MRKRDRGQADELPPSREEISSSRGRANEQGNEKRKKERGGEGKRDAGAEVKTERKKGRSRKTERRKATYLTLLQNGTVTNSD